MRLAVAYALAILSAGLAAFYGWASAEGWQAGALKAAILAAIAFIGCHGPAFVSEAIDDRRWGRAAFNVLVTAVCFAVTLAGGMGTIAGAGDSVKAQRAKAADDTSRDKDSLTIKRVERAKLDARPLAAIQADLATAKAGRPYRATNGCEPDKVIGKARREACEAFWALEREAGIAERMVDLDGETARLTKSLETRPAAPVADPQASAIAVIFGITVDAAAAWYAFMASLAMELAAMAGMLNTHRAANTSDVLRAAGDQPRVFGRLDTFMDACVQPKKGRRATLAELKMAYQARCVREGLRAMSNAQFVERLRALCDERGLRVSHEGRSIYCMDVRLAA